MATLQLTSKRTIGYIVFDILALAFIYLVPTISHMLSFPLYLIEPMRIALILALVHTTKRNAYIIALTLPIFSYLVSAHPVFYKMLLISGELVLNVWLFYFILGRTKNAFVSILSSIVASKAIYYMAKFIAVALILKTGESIIATSLTIQVATTLVFSVYLGLMFRRR
ncbi:MAG: hypothetical protein RBT19_14100 [Tenuifilaceae bacterium]|jgi:hypothetical protein|nr:hypothetical protein [Tenuifilaceae bacterium]